MTKNIFADDILDLIDKMENSERWKLLEVLY